MEVVLQLFIFLKDILEGWESGSREVKGVDEKLAAVIHVEVVDEVLIVEGLVKFLGFLRRELVEANLLTWILLSLSSRISLFL